MTLIFFLYIYIVYHWDRKNILNSIGSHDSYLFLGWELYQWRLHCNFYLLWFFIIFSFSIKGWRPYPFCLAKCQNDVFGSTHPPTLPWKRQVWPNVFLLKNILHRYHRKQNKCKTYCTILLYYTVLYYTILYYILYYGIGLPAIPWWLYSSNIGNIIIKITQSFISFHMWHSIVGPPPPPN